MTSEARWEHIERTLIRISERHEALAQTVEILAGMQRASEERLAHYDELFSKNEVRLGQLMDTMNRLGNIVLAHEQRLDNLENR